MTSTADKPSAISDFRRLITDALAGSEQAASFSLLDFPDHANVGDSAIWLGEIEYFKRVWRAAPSYVCSVSDHPDDLKKALPPGPVFLHGGGNFGDVWENHQIWRERLLEALHDRQIIQLPQTIFFSTPQRVEKTARIVDKHPNFTLCVRDRRSYDMAAAAFQCPVILCPDMALFLGELPRIGSPKYDVTFLLRSDHETTGLNAVSLDHTSKSICTVDWLQESRFEIAGLRAAYRLLSALGGRDARKEQLYRALAKARVRRGIRTLGAGRTVVTDRLHAHIISLLLGIPNVWIDNSYGKLSSFIETWTSGVGVHAHAETLQGALEILGQWDVGRPA